MSTTTMMMMMISASYLSKTGFFTPYWTAQIQQYRTADTADSGNKHNAPSQAQHVLLAHLTSDRCAQLHAYLPSY